MSEVRESQGGRRRARVQTYLQDGGGYPFIILRVEDTEEVK